MGDCFNCFLYKSYALPMSAFSACRMVDDMSIVLNFILWFKPTSPCVIEPSWNLQEILFNSVSKFIPQCCYNDCELDSVILAVQHAITARDTHAIHPFFTPTAYIRRNDTKINDTQKLLNLKCRRKNYTRSSCVKLLLGSRQHFIHLFIHLFTYFETLTKTSATRK